MKLKDKIKMIITIIFYFVMAIMLIIGAIVYKTDVITTIGAAIFALFQGIEMILIMCNKGEFLNKSNSALGIILINILFTVIVIGFLRMLLHGEFLAALLLAIILYCLYVGYKDEMKKRERIQQEIAEEMKKTEEKLKTIDKTELHPIE